MTTISGSTMPEQVTPSRAFSRLSNPPASSRWLFSTYNIDIITQSADDPCAAAVALGEAQSGAVAAWAEVVAGSSLASPADTSCSALGEDGSSSCAVAAGCRRDAFGGSGPRRLGDVARLDACVLVDDEWPADTGQRGAARSEAQSGRRRRQDRRAADPRGRLRAARACGRVLRPRNGGRPRSSAADSVALVPGAVRYRRP